jgi:CGNR zinc finger
MTPNQLQQELAGLQKLVAFAEGDSDLFPVLLLKTGRGLITTASSANTRLLTLSPRQIAVLQTELRAFMRDLAHTGQAHTIAPYTVGFMVATHAPDPPARGPRRVRQAASLLVDGDPRDVLWYQTEKVLTAVGLERLRLCPAPECGRAFVRVTQKRFCSTRCQTRIYMRERRAKDKAEEERFLHGTKTRTRRR